MQIGVHNGLSRKYEDPNSLRHEAVASHRFFDKTCAEDAECLPIRNIKDCSDDMPRFPENREHDERPQPEGQFR